ncbi:deoxyguanosinetriphosphate triphosphohydrolase family protein [Tautonia plasticadhaerens]|uniref:Deoxyguanosinetriphosphate triphosphohydrolase n=1 Tax=Tautonia plasticadhaerens TaxID=2527974 RepID=A0A518GZU8_9BACT|nr:dNTP triphosphohydrolase [Tautonia plasticadhaerens]QDV34104.1 Deoxyguanosinetriphosphate triphosphohydrolase [Tautonia plasticadhaerens]
MKREDRKHPDGTIQGKSSPADRDRILYSPEFRRLASVTQVAVAEGGLLFHNRLTHSLKVAQIGRRLAEGLLDSHREIAVSLGGIDPETVESAALAHDLGHPPFGHVAERKLDKLLLKEGVADGFEGNPQSFRIVTKIAVQGDHYDGLNLARATLNALLKYPHMRKPSGKGNKKWGAYTFEEDDFRFARALQTVGNGDSMCVEAQIMTWADDITYSVHDIEDFYQAGLIPLDQLTSKDGREVDRFLANVFERWSRKGITSKYGKDELSEAFRGLLKLAPIQEPYSGARRQQAALRNFTSGLIDRYVGHTKLIEGDNSSGNLEIDKNILMEVEMLKELLWYYVIKNPALASQEHGQSRIIEELFNIFAQAATSNDSDDWAILPGRARELIDEIVKLNGQNTSKNERLRVVADTVAGMTEQQALQMFHRLTAISPGSLFQPIAT